MSVQRGVEIFVGIMLLASVALTVFVHPGFVWMTVAIAVNVIQQAITGFCPAAMVLHRLGLRTECELCAQGAV